MPLSTYALTMFETAALLTPYDFAICIWVRFADTFSSNSRSMELQRNEDACKVTWHFTADDARNKLASLYPKFSSAEE